MDKTINIGLSGHAERYRLERGRLRPAVARYLDRAAARLRDDPDRAEVLGDLERSIGDRLAALLGSGDRLVTAADIDGVLERDRRGRHRPRAGGRRGAGAPRRGRAACTRIREGQRIAGVCTGLAAYSEIDVDWVRTLFVFAALLTGGLLRDGLHRDGVHPAGQPDERVIRRGTTLTTVGDSGR